MESVQSIVVKRIIKLGKKFIGKHRTEAELKKIQKKPQRSIPVFMKRNFNVKKSYVENTAVYHVSSKNSSSNKGIIYLHGGAYVNQITVFHWLFIQKIVNNTGCFVIVPLYPLAPTNNYKDVFRIMLVVYKNILEKYNAENLTVMGDSAGGSIALALMQLAYSQKLPIYKNLIMISPCMDITLQNPEIIPVLEKDLMLDMSIINEGLMYANGENRINPLISPFYGEINLPTNMMLIIGTNDILYPDCKKFYFKVKEAGAKINYIEKENMVHCFPLFPIPEAQSVFLLICELLK
ncbi:MAG: alpha/beta hydrolase [Clostridia bacterium]|jgi:acetyl esterase/lipase